MTKTIGTTELGEILGVSNVQLGTYVKNGMPKEGVNKYPLKACLQWYINYKLQQMPSHDAEDEAKIRHLQAKAELAETKLATLRENLITVDDAVAVLAESLTAVKSTLQSLPSRIAPQVVHMDTPSEIEGLTKKIINEALTELSGVPKTMIKKAKESKAQDAETDEEI